MITIGAEGPSRRDLRSPRRPGCTSSLLNARVPLHVVQRYLGHLTPTMTSAQTRPISSTPRSAVVDLRRVKEFMSGVLHLDE